MDRDFILVMSSEALPRAFAVSAPDKGGHVVLAGFTPRFAATSPARSVKIVMDCSGSMGGESILQARQALLRALDRLRPEDTFNIIRFGSSSTMLFRKQEHADETHLKAAMAMARTMNADMGGTEMADALDRALSSPSPAGMPEDILLVTDGQVWDMDSVADRIARRKHRVFCIGVGSAVERGVLSTLSAKTGGEAMFVNVHEDMGKKVFEHFKRMTLTPADKPTFGFVGARPMAVAPKKLPPVFDGDMVLTCTWFETPPQEAVFSLLTPDGLMNWRTPVTANADWAEAMPRFAAAMKLPDLPDHEATALAVEYNLVSPFTNFLAVLERAEGEKPQELPGLCTVTHNIPHSWGGVGGMADLPSFSLKPLTASQFVHDACFDFAPFDEQTQLDAPPWDNTTFHDNERNLRTGTDSYAQPWFETVLAQAIPAIRSQPDMKVAFYMLAAWGVPEDIM
jgi:Ca-activated chloride channel family protein